VSDGTVVNQLVIDGLEVEVSGIAHPPQVQA
jgi:hypothetical protein